MKTRLPLSIVASVIVALACSASAVNQETGISVGTRFHIEHSSFEDLPYGDGDMSYGIAFEWHENDAYWQICVNFAQKLTKTNDTEHVVSPQLNLLLKDNFWRGGVGAMWSYVEREKESGSDSDWLDVYWQFMFGVSMPIYGMTLDLMAYYVFEDWDRLDDFDLNDIEFGAWLGFKF